MTDDTSLMYYAIDDFRLARQRAIVSEILSKLSGTNKPLLSFEEVRKILKIQGSIDRGVRDIPLESIIGSVNRYQDFTRDFLPLRNIDPQRWAKVEILANGSIGLPPIDVYQIGKVFFVIDGNHRVSVARKMGAKNIQAYVREVQTRVELTPDDTLNDVLLKSEYASFIERTNLLRKRPGADLHLTEAGQYCLLEDHISVHRYFMGIDFNRPVSEEEAAVHWYDTVYLPVIEIIRNKGLQRDFPNRTEADLYLWIAEHRSYLEEALQTSLDPGRVVTNLSEQYSARPDRAASRISERVLDALLPNTLEAGPEPGTWRKEKFQAQFAQQSSTPSTISSPSVNSLFTDVLVPVNGTEIGWKALDQAILIAQREQSRLNGIHIVPTRLMKEEAAYVVQDRFDRTCSQAGIPGKLALSPGPVAQKIVERSRWNDLVVVNLTFPPSAQRLSKMGSGFRELVLRCPRPILVVPGVISDLSKPLLAFDGSPKSVEALYVVTYLCAKWKLPLAVISVIENPRSIVEVQKQAEEYLSSHHIEFKFIVRSGPIAQEILMEAEDKSCDWIVMGGYGESPLVNLLLDTVVDRILRSSSKPMLLCR